jgi:hypothetical protein
LSDWSSSDRYPLEDIDARILQILEAEPWSPVRTNDRWVLQDSCVDGASPSNHFSQHKNRHFKWVPYFLDDDLRAKRLEGTRQLLDVLQAQERCHFRDIIAGDETWIYLDMNSGTVWLPTDAEPPVRVKRTIASESACWSFSGKFTESHTITGSQKIAHYIHHSFVKKC